MKFSNSKVLKLIKNKKTLVFDFDGVIANSVNIKGNAFYRLYSPYGEDIAQKVLKYHLENLGMSRYDKFKFYQSVLLGEKISDDSIRVLSKKFSEMVVKDVVKSPEIEGVSCFIDACCNKSRSCDINSAVPQEEIRDIVNKRGIGKYFRNIYGSPSTKTENLKSSLSGKDKSSMIFFGDTKADISAADAMSIDFVGIGEHMFDLIDSNNGRHFAVASFLDLV